MEKTIASKKNTLNRAFARYISRAFSNLDINCYYENEHINEFIDIWYSKLKKNETGFYVYITSKGEEIELINELQDHISTHFPNMILNTIEKWNKCIYDSKTKLKCTEITSRQIYKYRELYESVNREALKTSDDELMQLFTRTSLSNEIDALQAIVKGSNLLIPPTKKQVRYINKLYTKLNKEVDFDISSKSKDECKIIISNLLSQINEENRIDYTPGKETNVISIFDYL